MERKFTEQERIRRAKLDQLKKWKIAPYGLRKDFSHNSAQMTAEVEPFSREELVTKKIVISMIGRIMLKRGPFIVLQDSQGQMQCYFSTKANPELTEFIAFLDIGDIVWVKGEAMRTQSNEITLKLAKLELLSKSLRPLPEKYHSLTNKEERQRRRYVDLIMNQKTRDTFWLRSKIISYIRQYFDQLNYMEVDTPILQAILGGAAARPFSTHHNALNMEFYLRVATELPLKKLIVGGIDSVYEIGRIFRNEGVDSSHNPEFTSIEFYEANSDLNGMMMRTEGLFAFLSKKLNKKEITFKSHLINLQPPFKKITMRNAILERTGIDFYQVKTLKEAQKIADDNSVKYEPFHEIGHIVVSFFEEFVEDTLIQPTFITEFPIEISPLAAKIVEDPLYTHRAELFINGWEYANMFTELHDPVDQFERFEQQMNEREQGNDEANEMDLDFVEALEYGMAPTGGAGIGIDRLIMLLTNNYNITDVILFPHLKNRPK